MHRRERQAVALPKPLDAPVTSAVQPLMSWGVYRDEGLLDMLTAEVFLCSGRGVRRGVRRVGLSNDWERCAKSKMIKRRSRACKTVIQRQPGAELWLAKNVACQPESYLAVLRH